MNAGRVEVEVDEVRRRAGFAFFFLLEIIDDGILKCTGGLLCK